MKKLTLLLVLIMALMSCEENELQLQNETVDFYNWDMTIVNEMIIQNPIEIERIQSYQITIFIDYENYYIETYDFKLNGAVRMEKDRIIMTIGGDDLFKSKLFNSTDQIRGQVYIKYY